jgi:putative NADH-flavin reductase
MRLLILGASGGVGSWVVRLAVQRGHALTAVARPGATLDVPGVTIERGDVTDPAFLHRVVPGHRAVISCLGLRRAGRSPYAELLSPPDLTARVTRQLVDALHGSGVHRVIAISAAGVGDSFARLTWPVRRLVSTGNVAVAYRDLENMETQLERSGLDWLAVRPVTLMNGEPTGRVRPVDRYGLFSIIRRADLAVWMLDAVEQIGGFAHRRVMLGSRAD